ncbi:MAG: beta-ketoacyl-[acyl-carrier-protein] synthase [Proteobacteria bacterium]|nr:beta-ketoacyl-[acyl-carrier-protein] synthase [Pseudomonadota bacterium]
MSEKRVVVTGMGAVSCFGAGVERLWQGLLDKKSGIRPVSFLAPGSYRSTLGAEVPWTALAEHEDCGGELQTPEEATRLALIAANEAIAQAGLAGPAIEAAGCVLGTLCSSSRVTAEYMRQFALSEIARADTTDADVAIVSHQLNHVVGRYRLHGPVSMVSTACSSSTDAIGYAADFIRSGDAEIMLCGGADIISEFAHAGFCSVFSITRDVARPFDKSRTGFFIGEGAGMLVLESLEHARARRANIYAEVLGYGLSNAAFHLTATSEDGSGEALAVRRALTEGGIAPEQVSYLNAHGTATHHNDLTEVQVIRSVFGAAPKIAISSIKANIGHCMGAAGALEAIATIKCIEHGFIPPTLNSSGDVDEALNIVIGDGLHLPVNYALSESFGFAGACSALLLGAPHLIDQASV